MPSSFIPAKTSLSRVFLIEGGARGDNQPVYESSFAMGSLSQGFGDVTKIEVPHPQRYGQYKEIGNIRGSTERPTTSLVGRFAADLKSTMLRIAQQGCAVDLHCHFGTCENPSNFNDFKKGIILKDAIITSWGTGDLGGLSSDSNAEIDETAEISASAIIEILPLTLAQKATDLTTLTIIDVVIADSVSCGECSDNSDGCSKVFALSINAGGSAGTPADVVYSLDKGATWYAHDVDNAADDPSALAIVGDYVVVTSNTEATTYSALKSLFTDDNNPLFPDDPTFTAVATGLVATGEPNDIWSIGNTAFLVGDTGHVYKMTDPTAGVTVLDAGVANANDLFAVHALNEDFVVAVGAHGAIVWSEDGASFSDLTTTPVAANITINAVWIVSEDVWWIGTSTGLLYYTKDQGLNWTAKAFTGSGAGSVDAIAFSDSNNGYMVHTTGATVGRILRTYDGGYSWVVLPEDAGTVVMNQGYAVASCETDPNFVVGVGLDTDAATGAIIVGKAN